MRSTAFRANKLLLIEKRQQHYLPAGKLPLEYLKLLIPCTGAYFREDDDCEILSQHIGVGPFSVWAHDIFATEDIVLLPYTPLHIFALHYMYEDSLQADVQSAGDFTLAERECNLFNLPPGVHRVPMAGGQKVLSVHINIFPHLLPLLVRKFPALECLMVKRHDQAGSSTVNKFPYHVNAVCDFIIQKMLSCRYLGQRADYFIYRCCVDLFLNFAQQHTMAHKPFLFTNMLHMDVYTQLFKYIIAHPHKQNTLPELAMIYDIPSAELAMGFVQHFGISLEAFDYMVKMMMAFHQVQKRYMELEDVAVATGFRNKEEMVWHLEGYYQCKIAGLRSGE